MISISRIFMGRPRLFAAIAIGLLAAILLPGHMTRLSRTIGSWDIGCAAYLILIATMFAGERQSSIAIDAERQQEGEWTIFWFTMAGAFASFAAIIGEFAVSKDLPNSVRGGHAALVAATLLLSWLLTHTLFALRYAHEYYEIQPGHSDFEKGLDFPGGQNPDYWDFFYFAVVVGMTFQVSDVQITSRKFRRLATVHGLLGFLFNTVILALSVNIGASLL